MVVVFFSYSHKDEALRAELEIHLAALKRHGSIQAWHDRRIMAGDDFAGAISENLERADIILLLVSPYFLASDYCYDVEMKRALERHAAGEARVIPVILHPCDWHGAPFGKLKAVPTDGKPISKYPNQHDALLEVAKAIRAIAEHKGTSAASNRPTGPQVMPVSSPIKSEARSSNLRVKKAFTDHDRDTFREAAFEYIANFFEGSLKELEQRNEGISTNFRRINANHFTATVYRHGKSMAECGVRLDAAMGKQIVFSHNAQSTNSYNEALGVGDDGHTLHLKASGFSQAAGGGGKGALTQQGGAELFWSLLMEPLQR
jgi:hypothetical protein